MATKTEVSEFFSELEKLNNKYLNAGFSFLITGQIYTLEKEYLGEVYSNALDKTESRFLLFQNMEYIISLETANHYENQSNKSTETNQF